MRLQLGLELLFLLCVHVLERADLVLLLLHRFVQVCHLAAEFCECRFLTSQKIPQFTDLPLVILLLAGYFDGLDVSEALFSLFHASDEPLAHFELLLPLGDVALLIYEDLLDLGSLHAQVVLHFKDSLLHIGGLASPLF